MLNVLVSAIETPAGRGLLKGLRKSRLRTRVTGMARSPMTAALYQLERAYLNETGDDAATVDALVEIARREMIDAFLPGSDADHILFWPHRSRLADEAGAVWAGGQSRLAGRGDDRLTAYAFFNGEDIDYPRTVPGDDSAAIESLLNDCGWPLVVKGRWGYTSQHPQVAATRQELETMVRSAGEAIVQEYVSDEEGDFVASVFGSRQARPVASVVLRRVVDRGGIGTRYERCRDVSLAGAVETIAQKLEAVGPMTLHFRPRNGRPCLLAAGPNFSETTAAALAMGYNEAEMALKQFAQGRKAARPVLKDAVVFEAAHEVILEGMTFDGLAGGTAVGRCRVRTLPIGP